MGLHGLLQGYLYLYITVRVIILDLSQRNAQGIWPRPLIEVRATGWAWVSQGLSYGASPSLPSTVQLQQLSRYFLPHFSFLSMRNPEAKSQNTACSSLS
jgi:hypothetical protein